MPLEFKVSLKTASQLKVELNYIASAFMNFIWRLALKYQDYSLFIINWLQFLERWLKVLVPVHINTG